jgi:hypothetical protein
MPYRVRADNECMAVGLRPLWPGSLIGGRCNGEHRPFFYALKGICDFQIASCDRFRISIAIRNSQIENSSRLSRRRRGEKRRLDPVETILHIVVLSVIHFQCQLMMPIERNHHR